MAVNPPWVAETLAILPELRRCAHNLGRASTTPMSVAVRTVLASLTRAALAIVYLHCRHRDARAPRHLLTRATVPWHVRLDDPHTTDTESPIRRCPASSACLSHPTHRTEQLAQLHGAAVARSSTPSTHVAGLPLFTEQLPPSTNLPPRGHLLTDLLAPVSALTPACGRAHPPSQSRPDERPSDASRRDLNDASTAETVTSCPPPSRPCAAPLLAERSTTSAMTDQHAHRPALAGPRSRPAESPHSASCGSCAHPPHTAHQLAGATISARASSVPATSVAAIHRCAVRRPRVDAT